MTFKATTGLALVLALLSASDALAEKAGVAAAVNPDAQGTPPGEQTHFLTLGLDVARNEHIVTSANGLTQLLFNDGSTLSLGPSADVTIDEFVYNPSTGTGKMALTLGKGVMRLVGGQIANSSDVTVKTPAATIGIRGAIGGVSVDGDGSSTAYMAYGNNMTVTGNSGPPQTVTHGNFAINVPPGGPASPPIPLTPGLLVKLTGALEPPANGGGGGAKSAPTEQSVQQSSGGSGGSLGAPPPPPPPPVPQFTNTTNNYTQVAQNAAQGGTAAGTAKGIGLPTLSPNTTYGPYLFNSYRFLQTTGFTTDANGYMISLNNGPISWADPASAALNNTNAGSTDVAIGTPTNVTSIGLAQIGIWQGDVYTGPIQDPKTGIYSVGTITNPLPSNYFMAVPTTTLPQSGHYVYSLAASTPLVSARTDANGNTTGGIIAGSRLANSTLTADFGYGGPNSAQLFFGADLIIPGDGTLHISDRMVNYPLTRFFFFTSNGSVGTVTPLGASSYCNSSTSCQLSTQGYFSGAAGLAQIALGYFVNYSDLDDNGYGSLTGSAIYQFNSSISGPSGPSTVGFWPGSTVAGVLMRTQGANLSVANFDIVDTGADGVPNSLSFVPVPGSGQVAEQGGDQYVQARRLTGMLSAFGSTFSTSAGGMHEIYAIPTVTLPTSGTLSYNLLYATSPTYGDNYGGPGHFSSGPINATFTPTGITIALPQMTVALSDDTFTIHPTTITGVTSPIFSATAAVSAGSFNHLCPDCSPNYIAQLKGLFAGPDALRAALLYAISNGGYGLAINGAALYRH